MAWVVDFSKWGYGERKHICQIDEDEADTLRLVKDALTRHLVRKNGAHQHCLNDEKVQGLLDKALALVDMSCCSDPNRRDIEIDRSNYDEWALTNPYCVPFEAWENAFGCLAPEIGFKVVESSVIEKFKALFTVKEIDSLKSRSEMLYTLDVIGKALDCKVSGIYTNLVEDCQFDVNVSAKELKTCALKYDVSSKVVKKCLATFDVGLSFIEKCNFNYNLLLKEKPDCNIDFELYLNLINCNFSHDLISKSIDCGLNLTYDINKDTPEINLPNGSKIPFCDFDFEITSQINCDLVSGVIGEDFCGYDCSHDIIEILEEYNS